MYKCERCKENDARVRLDSIVNGKRESHYFCRECAEQIMGGELNAATPGTRLQQPVRRPLRLALQRRSWWNSGRWRWAANGLPWRADRDGSARSR